MTKRRGQPGQPLGRLRAEVVQPKPLWILDGTNLDNLANLFNTKDLICAGYGADPFVSGMVEKVGKVDQVDQPLSVSGFSKDNLKGQGCRG